MCENLEQLHDEVKKEAEMSRVGAADNVFPGNVGHYCGSRIARAREKADVRSCQACKTKE